MWRNGMCAAALCALAVVVGGCAEDEGRRTKTVTVQETATKKPGKAKDPAVAVSTRPSPAEAVAYVEDYYGLIDQYSYRAAWAVLPAAVKAEQAGYAAWREGYRSNLDTTVVGARTSDASKNSTVVSLDLRAKDVDACSSRTVRQGFSGTWSFTRAGDEWIAEDITMDKVSGGTPILTAADCPVASPPQSEPPPVAPSRPPSSSGGDLDCADVPETNFYVPPSDPNGFDADSDGVGCET